MTWGWHWPPWSRPAEPNADAARAAAAVLDSRHAVEFEKSRGPEVTRVSDALREHARINHVAELLQAAMTPRRD